MYVQPRMLIVSTDDDPSLSLFETEEAKSLISPDFYSYANKDELKNKDYQFVYFRDPFNSSNVSISTAKQTTTKIIDQIPDAYFVDNIRSFNEMFIEDKFEQYKLFAELMPKTEILSSIKNLEDSIYQTHIIKKRISSRARDIILSSNDLSASATANNYIIQPKLEIKTEYRVYMVGGEIILPLAIKSSKKINQKVKLTGVTNAITPEIKSICHKVFTKLNFDLMGLDIACADNGTYLLEINRSCQFDGFLRESNLNLALKLNQFLVPKLNN